MASLQEISASGRLNQSVVDIMVQEKPLIGQFEYYPHPGNADNPRKSSSADGGQYRSVNTDYPDNEVDPAFADLKLAILGDKVEVDVAHERRGFDIASVRTRDLRSFARGLSKFYLSEHIKGGGQGQSPIAINGLEGELPMSASQAIYAEDNSNALVVESGNSDAARKSQDALKLKLHQLVRLVEGDPVLIMSDDMQAFVSSVFSDLVDPQEDNFGNLFESFRGTPMFTVGKDRSGNPILPEDENPGSITADTQSIYAVSYEEGEDLAMSTNVGVQVEDKGIVDSQYVHHVDFDTQQGVLNDEAVGRLAGVQLDV
jgi:hypothetical protein